MTDFCVYFTLFGLYPNLELNFLSLKERDRKADGDNSGVI